MAIQYVILHMLRWHRRGVSLYLSNRADDRSSFSPGCLEITELQDILVIMGLIKDEEPPQGN